MMYTIEELRGWWEVPAIAHFFSLFKSCFQLTDFTIEELEEALLGDGVEDKSTIFTSRLLTELLQGCYNNPNISVTTYHDALISIMKKRWEEEEGRINPLSSINADFHSLPTQLKAQIIHRLTEYRLDAQDVADKLAGLNPSDLRLEPLGVDHNGSRYWYFFGVRLYKETPSPKLSRKRKHENTEKSNSGTENGIFTLFTNKNHLNNKKKKKKRKKHKKLKESKHPAFPPHGLSENIWEIVCYDIRDWKKLATSLEGATSRKEEALRQLIIDNFLPNLPKIVEDMDKQQMHKSQVDHPRRSSCRLLAKKLHEEEDTETTRARLVADREENEKIRREEEQKRLESDFEVMLAAELERARKIKLQEFVKDQEEERRKRLFQGLPLDSASSSEEGETPDVRPPKPPGKGRGRRTADIPVVGKRKGRLVKSKRGGRSGAGSNHKTTQPSKVEPEEKPEQTPANQNNDLVNEDGFDRETGEAEFVAMMETWRLLDDHPEAWPFQKPVEEWYAPGYHNIIKRPMDLSTIEEKINKKTYKNVVEFKDDITLMFNNCRLYNGPDNEYTQVANELDVLFKTNLLEKLSPAKEEKKAKAEPKSKNKKIKKEASPSENNKDSEEAFKEEQEEEEEDEQEDSEDPDSSSSDEFAPPGVSKALLKKKRLEMAKTLGVIKDKPLASKAKTPARLNNGNNRRSSVEVGAKRKKSTTDDESIKSPPPRRSSVTRGRPKSSMRGRRASTRKTRDKSESESDDARPPLKRAFRGGRTRRGGAASRARANRKTSAKPETSESEASNEGDSPAKEEDVVTEETADNTDALSTDHEKEAEAKSLTPVPEEVAKPEEPQSPKEKVQSPPREGDSSSSSSRASSRSPSLEKFEKLEEDAKSKPQVMWSLDYLASQARVLEEQHRKLEASTSSTRELTRKQSVDSVRRTSSQPGTPDVVARQPALDDFKKFSPPSALQPRRRNSNLSPANRSLEENFVSKQRRTTPGGEDDPYNFRDEDSPASLFTNKPPSVPPAVVDKTSMDSPRENIGLRPDNEVRRQDNIPPHRHDNHVVTPSPRTPTQAPLQHPAQKDLSPPAKEITRPLQEQRRPESSPLGEMMRHGFVETSPRSMQAVTALGKPPTPQVSPQTPQTKPQTPLTPTHLGKPPTPLGKPPTPLGKPPTPLGKPPTPLGKPPTPLGKPPTPLGPPSVPSNPLTPLNVISNDVTNSIRSPMNYARSPIVANNKPPVTSQPLPQQPPTSTPPHRGLPRQSPQPHTDIRSPLGQYQHSPTPLVKHTQEKAPEKQQLEKRGIPPHVQPPSHNPQNRLHSYNPHMNPKNQPEPHFIPQNLADPQRRHSGPKNPQLTPKNPSNPHMTPKNPSESHLAPKNPANPHINPKQPTDPQRRHSGPTYDHQRPPEGNYRGPQPTSTPQQCNYRNPPPPPAATGRRSSVTSSTTSAGHDNAVTSPYPQDGISNTPLLLQNPTMANFGMSPWSLAQSNEPQHNTTSGGRSSQRKSNNQSTGGNSSYPSKSTSNVTATPSVTSQSHHHQQQHYHPVSTSGMHPQHNSSSSGHQSSKQRSQSTESHVTSSKHRPNSNHVTASNNSSSQSASSSRRQSGGNAMQQYQKNATDYMGYHIPPTPAPTPRDARTPVYSPHQQNGLLAAAATHQDLTASATLSRALQQQQHKSDRPSSHAAAASMFHHYAAQQGAVAAASEQYNRLASAHRATPQHPLAGVYHHHQSAATSSAQHAAAHLSAPWLQAGPGAAYPSNLLPPPHMDPVYQLIQQSGMHGHGQYQMYPNPVVQQLTQQHLQHHHMLPKY